MSSAASLPVLPPGAPAISAAAQAAGKVTIVGFGSLLSRRSARSTFPALENFRPAVLRGFRRIFAHVAAIFVERGIANVQTGEMSSLSVEPCDDKDAELLVCLFEIPLSALPSFFEREQEFRWAYVPVLAWPSDGSVTALASAAAAASAEAVAAIDGQALACLAYSDAEYKAVRLGGSADAFHEAYGRWGLDSVWRDDILPCPVYLRHVVLAAANLDREVGSVDKSGKREVWSVDDKVDAVAPAASAVATAAASLSSAAAPSSTAAGASSASEDTDPTAPILTSTRVSLACGRILSSFLDGTFLADRRTTIRQYLRTRPDIMLLQPPESLKERYSG
jgi:hypothetical protein